MSSRSPSWGDAMEVGGVEEHSLKVSCWQVEEPKCQVLILHGMAEHHQRYSDVAESLNSRGISVFGYDHRGHGPQVEQTNLGHYSDYDGWRKVVYDAISVVEALSKLNPNLPLVLLGHSMGSFILQRVAFEVEPLLTACILSGSTWQNPLMMRAASQIAWWECRRQGNKGRSSLIHFLSFGSFNQKFKPNRTEFDWLSRDNEAVDRYADDPFCGFRCTNLTWYELLQGLAELYDQKARYKKLPKKIPYYLLGGSDDPVGSGGGLKKLADQMKESGCQDVTCVIYPHARHEVFNEINREQVIKELIAWIERKIN